MCRKYYELMKLHVASKLNTGLFEHFSSLFSCRFFCMVRVITGRSFHAPKMYCALMMVVHIWKYAEILPAKYVTCTPSIGTKFVVDITVHCILYQGRWLDAPLTVQSFSHKGYNTPPLSLSVCRYCWYTAGSVGGRRCSSETEKCTHTGTYGR